MKNITTVFSIFLVLAFLILPVKDSWSGASIIPVETDGAAEDALIGFFDLRDRETFIQVTNLNPDDAAGETLHIQIFNVGNLCGENDFFDFYTPNDTHVYNLRDITRNDGTANTVLLPDDAYGIFVANVENDSSKILIGNLRILDNNGYEYRTNLVGNDNDDSTTDGPGLVSFNFNSQGGVSLSDIVSFQSNVNSDENNLNNILQVWAAWTVEIVDLNEDVSSCRNVITACTDQDNPLLSDLLFIVNSDDNEDLEEEAANVASFEYGINESVPSSKGAPLLCPGNTITDGFVRLELNAVGDTTEDEVTMFIGLNNGNGRGSMDTLITESNEDVNP